MKKMKKIVVAIASTVVVMAGSVPQLAFAGQYIWGTPSANSKEALNEAIVMAKETVKSRKSGCLGPGKDDQVTQAVVKRQDGNKVQYGIFISHRNGSCNIKEGFIGNANRELGVRN